MINFKEEYFDYSNITINTDWMGDVDQKEQDIYKNIVDYGSQLPTSAMKPKILLQEDGWYGFILQDVPVESSEELPGLWVHRAKEEPRDVYDPPKGQVLGVTAKLTKEGYSDIKNFLDSYIE